MPTSYRKFVSWASSIITPISPPAWLKMVVGNRAWVWLLTAPAMGRMAPSGAVRFSWQIWPLTAAWAILRRCCFPAVTAAVRHPARMALSYLHAAYGDDAFRQAEALGLEFTPLEKEILARQLTTGWNSPRTSSAGRLFDAVAAALNICRQRTYEGQPALELEMAAADLADDYYPLKLDHQNGHLVLDTISLFRQSVADFFQGTPAGRVAARFHESLARACEDVCIAQRQKSGLNLVALSGGVWQNALLFSRCRHRLQQAGFEVLHHRQVPPNDGGIALGQAAVAAAMLSRE